MKPSARWWAPRQAELAWRLRARPSNRATRRRRPRDRRGCRSPSPDGAYLARVVQAPCCRAGSPRAPRRRVAERVSSERVRRRPLPRRSRGRPLRPDLLELTTPAVDLALDVAVMAGQVRRVPPAPRRRREAAPASRPDGRRSGPRRHVKGRFRLGAIAQNRSLDELHDVKRSLVDLGIDAQPERLGDGNTVGIEGSDDRVFAHHVVGRGQHVTDRRAAQARRLPRPRRVTRKVRLDRPPAMSSNSRGRWRRHGRPSSWVTSVLIDPRLPSP